MIASETTPDIASILRPVTVLDDALTTVGAMQRVKMDAEGAGHLALSGEPPAFARSRSVVFDNDSEDCRVLTLLEAIRRFEECSFVAPRAPDKSIA